MYQCYVNSLKTSGLVLDTLKRYFGVYTTKKTWYIILMATKIDIPQLRKEIRNMTPDQTIYQVLRDELKRLGYWRRRRIKAK